MIRQRDLLDRHDSRFRCNCRNLNAYALFYISNVAVVFQIAVEEIRCMVSENSVEDIGCILLASLQLNLAVLKPVLILLLPCILTAQVLVQYVTVSSRIPSGSVCTVLLNQVRTFSEP